MKNVKNRSTSRSRHLRIVALFLLLLVSTYTCTSNLALAMTTATADIAEKSENVQVQNKDANANDNINVNTAVKESTSRDENLNLNLNQMYEFLRGGDKRLIRYNVPSQDAFERQKKACNKNDLIKVLQFLSSSSLDTDLDEIKITETTIAGQRKMNEAIFIITTCTIDNPTNREIIGKYGGSGDSNRNNDYGKSEGSILKILIDMLEKTVTMLMNGNENGIDEMLDQDIVDGAALAAEAIWILSFNNAHNHNFFLSGGAIPALSRLVQYEDNGHARNSNGNNDHDRDRHQHQRQRRNEHHRHNYPSLNFNLLKMWSAAALQNLAASYCLTESGHCYWEYDRKKGLHLHPNSPIRNGAGDTDTDNDLGSLGRREIEGQEGLLPFLRRAACDRGQVPMSSSSMANIMASEALYGDPITNEFTTWAITGAIRNIALDPNMHEEIRDMKECLCDLFHSIDWLESSKAEDILIRTGMEGSCTPPYYKNCQDKLIEIDSESGELGEWRNEYGETCKLYAENYWCEEYGELVSRDGTKANEACCVCNGGMDISNSQKREL